MRRRLHITYLSLLAAVVAAFGAHAAFAGGGSTASSGSSSVQPEGCGFAGCVVDRGTPKTGFYVGDTFNGHSIEFSYSSSSQNLTHLRRDGKELLAQGAVRNNMANTSQNGYNFTIIWSSGEIVDGNIKKGNVTERFSAHREFSSDSF